MKYLVIYCVFPVIRERIFDNKEDAEAFSLTVNGSVCELKKELKK